MEEGKRAYVRWGRYSSEEELGFLSVKTRKRAQHWHSFHAPPFNQTAFRLRRLFPEHANLPLSSNPLRGQAAWVLLQMPIAVQLRRMSLASPEHAQPLALYHHIHALLSTSLVAWFNTPTSRPRHSITDRGRPNHPPSTTHHLPASSTLTNRTQDFVQSENTPHPSSFQSHRAAPTSHDGVVDKAPLTTPFLKGSFSKRPLMAHPAYGRSARGTTRNLHPMLTTTNPGSEGDVWLGGAEWFTSLRESMRGGAYIGLDSSIIATASLNKISIGQRFTREYGPGLERCPSISVSSITPCRPQSNTPIPRGLFGTYHPLELTTPRNLPPHLSSFAEAATGSCQTLARLTQA